MAQINQGQIQKAKQVQRQQQKISQSQIQALKFLEMNSQDLSDEIYKAASENPVIEIVEKKYTSNHNSKAGRAEDTEKFNKLLENTEDRSETLQSHLIHQLNSMNLTEDEYELSEKLIYNLDKNGFYGSSIAPSMLLNKKRPQQNFEMLERCINRIQKMDPVGVCTKNPEESLYIQACNSDEKNPLALFLLNGHLELVNPPEPMKILKKLQDYKKDWHKKTFAGEILLDKIKLDEKTVSDALKFILRLNPNPAQNYSYDSYSDFEKPDVVLIIEKKQGRLSLNDYGKGLVCGNEDFYFQIKYSSGALPEIKIAEDFSIDEENKRKALMLINNLEFRKSTIVLQGCAIVNSQKQFFLEGPKALLPLTRRKIAEELGIHESTVSRTSAKNSSKFAQTEWGLFPISYFFTSGVSNSDGNKVSSESIKLQIQNILHEYGENSLSDLKLTELLNERGIKIARRTVAKYRNQAGIKNSYNRK